MKAMLWKVDNLGIFRKWNDMQRSITEAKWGLAHHEIDAEN